MKNLRVIYEILPNNDSQECKNRIATLRINEIGRPANEQVFKFEKSEITVRKFFEKQKNYKLKCPTLPCLVVKKTIKEDNKDKDKENEDKDNKDKDKDNKDKTTEIYLPAEVRKPLLYLPQMM